MLPEAVAPPVALATDASSPGAPVPAVLLMLSVRDATAPACNCPNWIGCGVLTTGTAGTMTLIKLSLPLCTAAKESPP